MEGGKGFDAYELIGVITPGAVVAFFLALMWPEFRNLLGSDGLSLGDLGMFLIASFVLGHLLQAGGNLIEEPVFLFGGLPTASVRTARQTLLSPGQLQALQRKVDAMEGVSLPIGEINRRRWRAITSRAYERVRVSGQSARIDYCNRTYGLMRGLAAAFLGALLWCAVTDPYDHLRLGVLTVIFAAAIWRMRRAGRHYARTLFLAFIDLK